MARELVRSVVAFAIAVALLTFYGGRVCPLIDSLGFGRLASILAFCFGVGLAFKAAALAAFKPHERRMGPWSFFGIDLAIWISVAIVFAAFDFFVWKFPFWTSGMKMAVGASALGFYASAFEALRRERALIEMVAAGKTDRFEAGPALNTAQRFFAFTSASLVLMSCVLLLLLYKDLVMEEIPIELSSETASCRIEPPFPTPGMAKETPAVIDAPAYAPPAHAHASMAWARAIFKEVLFVLGVLLLGTIVVTRQYAANLRRMFELEQQALDAVKSGRFDVAVPVISRDEFGEIADGTNGMIAGLREKEKIRSVLGKVVSPVVAKRILETGAMIGGDTAEATVLFTDLRDYTALSEKVTPQQLVTMLNEYFTMVNRLVEKHGGFVNKFIGDAVMAIYGLDTLEGCSEQAMRTALDVREGLLALNASFEKRGLPTIANGIGIHHGTLVAGVIGAEERVEFTVIGDTVNTAARLESLTKELNSFVAVSDAVYARLSDGIRAKMEPAGEHPLKGKAGKTKVYGLGEATRLSRA